MNRKQIEERISRVKPRKVFPIHTENPSLFGKTCLNVQKVDRGKSYIIE